MRVAHRYARAGVSLSAGFQFEGRSVYFGDSHVDDYFADAAVG